MKFYMDGTPILSDINQITNLSQTVKNIDDKYDLNTLTHGFYRLDNRLPANMPCEDQYGLVICVEVASNWILQFYVTLSAQIYKRAKINDDWTAWTK